MPTDRVGQEARLRYLSPGATLEVKSRQRHVAAPYCRGMRPLCLR